MLDADGEDWPAPVWHAGQPVKEVMEVMAVIDGKPIAFMAGAVPGIVVQTKTGLRAFRSRCAHAGLSLDTASVDRGSGALVCRWHAYRFDLESGGGLTAPHRCLEGWPLRVVDGLIWVCPPATEGSAEEADASERLGHESDDR